MQPDDSPLFEHPLDEESAFRPEALVDAVRSERGAADAPLPPVCVLDFDGDLTDLLVESGRSTRVESWACFHTTMEGVEVDGRRAGVVGRTIGGPYAVLVAEQMAASGVEVVLGLTSAGRVSTEAPLPGLVVADEALRDEGTSLHYLPASRTVPGHAGLAEALAAGLQSVPLPVARGLVWTTDAPYRETRTQLERHAAEHVLAVEMQAASLFAFAQARGVQVGVVAHLTNEVEGEGDDFDKGEEELSVRILEAMVRGAYAFLDSSSG